jgi:hypothetical protein
MWRLCKMNLAVRGIDADIKWNSDGYFGDWLSRPWRDDVFFENSFNFACRPKIWLCDPLDVGPGDLLKRRDDLLFFLDALRTCFGLSVRWVTAFRDLTSKDDRSIARLLGFQLSERTDCMHALSSRHSVLQNVGNRALGFLTARRASKPATMLSSRVSMRCTLPSAHVRRTPSP